MTLKKFGIIVGIATILGTIYAALQYHSGNSIRSKFVLSDVLKNKNESIILSVNDNIYKGERSWLLAMLEAAEKIHSSNSRDNALCDVVNTALSIKDYNMAIIAAEKIHYPMTRDNSLLYIVSVASKNKNGYSYAVLAANKIHYSSTKNNALQIIIYEAKKEATNRKQE